MTKHIATKSVEKGKQWPICQKKIRAGWNAPNNLIMTFFCREHAKFSKLHAYWKFSKQDKGRRGFRANFPNNRGSV